MSAYDLEEQEKIDELKTWWKLHGAKVTAALVAASVLLVGWQGFQWWQRRQAQEAGALYWALQEALLQQDKKRVRMLAGELIDKYGGAAQAGLGALVAGKVLAEAGDLKSAQAQFGWAAEHARDRVMKDLARLRQSIVALDEGAFDEALRLLAEPPTPSLMPRYLEIRGDVLLAQGKKEEARKAYEQAIKAHAEALRAAGLPGDAYAEILAAKRQMLGGGA